jgi:hypothetical protein
MGLGVAGGGNGSDGITQATSATSNTGSGGGAGAHSGTDVGGNGGSGIVIIRYPANCAPPTSTTGNPQINYADSYQIYTFTSSGTITF